MRKFLSVVTITSCGTLCHFIIPLHLHSNTYVYTHVYILETALHDYYTNIIQTYLPTELTCKVETLLGHICKPDTFLSVMNIT